MQSNGTRIVALLVALAAIVALFFAFRGGDDDGDATTAATTETAVTTTTDTDESKKKKQQDKDPSVPVIEVVGGEPRGGIAELEFEKGDEIRFDVTSDAPEEVHVHGYDVETEIGPDGPAKLEFPAELDGIFEVELHGSGAQIAEITVNP